MKDITTVSEKERYSGEERVGRGGPPAREMNPERWLFAQRTLDTHHADRSQRNRCDQPDDNTLQQCYKLHTDRKRVTGSAPGLPVMQHKK